MRRSPAGADAAPASLKAGNAATRVKEVEASVRLTAALITIASALWTSAASAQGGASVQDEALAQGRRLFTTEVQPSCTVCHALKDAGSTAEIGPPLDELKPDAGRVARALRNGIGVMPSFREKLSEAQIEALARYVAHATGAAR
jgi:mono/diheme cytochrome c family protein